MAEEIKIENIVAEEKTRRSAIKTAAQVAVTAPAVGLLLSASTKSASAATVYKLGDTFNTGSDFGVSGPCDPGDDFVGGSDTIIIP